MPFSGHPDNPTEHHRGGFEHEDQNPYRRSDASDKQPHAEKPVEKEPQKVPDEPKEPKEDKQEEQPKEEKKEGSSMDESKRIMSSVILKIIEIEKELDLSRETLSMLKDFSIE